MVLDPIIDFPRIWHFVLVKCGIAITVYYSLLFMFTINLRLSSSFVSNLMDEVR